jgi:cytochrome c biogenesis protein CcdA
METTPRNVSQFRGGVLLLLLGGLALLAILIGGMVLIPRYRAAKLADQLQRSDADRVKLEDLYLDVTLVTPSFWKSRRLERYLGNRDPQSVLPFLVGVNVHTGSVGHLHHLSGNFTLIGPDQVRYPSLTEPIVLSDHHNVYLVLFPSRDNRGEPFLDHSQGTLALEATRLGASPLRRFEWQLPVQDTLSFGATQGLAATAMLLVAFIGALLVVLSPCALELTLYYSAIISCAVSEGAQNAPPGVPPSRAAQLDRRRLLFNLGGFCLGFTLLYAVSGATVGLIGEGVRQPLGGHSGLLQYLGGTLILFFAMRVLGLDRWFWTASAAIRRARRFTMPEREKRHALTGGLPDFSRPAPAPRLSLKPSPLRLALARLRWKGLAASERRSQMKARDSFLAGLGLSSSCITCMGGSVLYPLLVYAGITSWYWGLLTLGLYSLGIALPMIFIALGFYQIRLSLGQRLGINRALRAVSGVMLAGIALLIFSGQEQVLTNTAFRVIGGISRWFV